MVLTDKRCGYCGTGRILAGQEMAAGRWEAVFSCANCGREWRPGVSANGNGLAGAVGPAAELAVEPAVAEEGSEMAETDDKEELAMLNGHEQIPPAPAEEDGILVFERLGKRQEWPQAARDYVLERARENPQMSDKKFGAMLGAVTNLPRNTAIEFRRQWRLKGELPPPLQSFQGRGRPRKESLAQPGPAGLEPAAYQEPAGESLAQAQECPPAPAFLSEGRMQMADRLLRAAEGGGPVVRLEVSYDRIVLETRG